MTNRETVLTYIANSERLENALNTICTSPTHIDDLRSHFYLQMAEMDEQKLITAYNEGKIDYLCIRVMKNQYHSKSSSFYYLYRKDINEELKQTNLQEPDSEIVMKELIEIRLADIMRLLSEKPYWETILFRQYYFENKTYQQIERETTIHYTTVMYKVKKLREWIQSRLIKD